MLPVWQAGINRKTLPSCGASVSESISTKGEPFARNVNTASLCKSEVTLDSRMHVVKGRGNVHFLDSNNKINLTMCFTCSS